MYVIVFTKVNGALRYMVPSGFVIPLFILYSLYAIKESKTLNHKCNIALFIFIRESFIWKIYHNKTSLDNEISILTIKANNIRNFLHIILTCII